MLFGVAGTVIVCLTLILVGAQAGAATTWQQVYVPNAGPSGQSAGMLSPTCFTASDCMAIVGHGLDHFNGATWTTASSATTTGLSTASCVSDLWCMVAGYSTSDTPEADLWNGSTWTQYEPPVPAGVDSYQASFSALSCASTQDCWALGTYYGDSGGFDYFQQFADQWNGSSWTSVVMNYQPGWGVEPTGIDCAGDGTCEAVGWYQTNSPYAGSEYTLAEKYTGTQWVAQTAPSPGETDNILEAVTCVTDVDCTAVGMYSTYFVVNSVGQQSLIEHYNGTTWSQVPTTAFRVRPCRVSRVTPRAQAMSARLSVRTTVRSPNERRADRGPKSRVPNPGGVGTDSLAGVSCTAPGSCMAVGREVLADELYGPMALTTAGGSFAPGVSHLSESDGPLSGGDTMTIIGAGFSAGSGTPVVKFGNTTATDVEVLGDDQLTATVPPATSPSSVDVTVSTAVGSSPLTPSDEFDYLGQPVVSGVSPNIGASYTAVTLTGTGLAHVTDIEFGNTSAEFSTVSDTQITAYAPNGPKGTVDITVTSLGGTSSISPLDHYTYVAPPEIDSLTPGFGPQGGGTDVVLKGSGLAGATEVDLAYAGDCDCGSVLQPDSFTVVSDSEIDFVTPPADVTGFYDVTVTGPGGTSDAQEFNYGGSPPPTITSLSPVSGAAAGGNVVTVLGSGFTGTTEVDLESVGGDFEDDSASYTVVSDSEIDVTMPENGDDPPDVVDVRVDTDNGGSQPTLVSQYTYLGASPPPAPVVTGVSPASGAEAGTCGITITGTGLDDASTIQFGVDKTSPSFSEDSPTELTACAPSGTAGPVDVVVTADGGTSAVTAADTFTFVPPSVTSVSPATCSDNGGCSVVITGAGFTDDDAVRFGSSGADWWSSLTTRPSWPWHRLLPMAPTRSSTSPSKMT